MLTDEERKALGAKLRELRKGLGMTLAEVEAATDKSCSALYACALEESQVKFPAPHILYALAGAYVYPYEKLLELAGYIRPKPLTGTLNAK